MPFPLKIPKMYLIREAVPNHIKPDQMKVILQKDFFTLNRTLFNQPVEIYFSHVSKQQIMEYGLE